ncbi:MAG: ATP-binding cassette domain-containing protein, partial [Rhodospirillales bacterium]|nr:ATP-binding cassette domain-containing protein [Rhodospirillales bacterium]
MIFKQQRAWLTPFIEPLKATFREVLILSLFVNILALAVPVFVLQVYDRVVFHAGISTLQGLVIGMALILSFDYALRQTRARVMQAVALRIDIQVGRYLFNKLNALPLATLESKPTAYWQALFRDVEVVRNTLSGSSALLICDLPFIFLFLSLIFVIAQPIAWLLMIILPIFLFIAWRAGNVMSDANKSERQSGMSRDALIAEIIGGRTTIKALALDRAMRPLWEEKHADTIENALVRGSRADGFSNLGSSLTMLTTIGMTTVGAIAILDQKLTIGALIATNMLSSRLLGPLNQLVGTWRSYASFLQSVDRLGQIFEATEERQVSEVSLQRPKGEIVLEKVSFSYLPNAPKVVGDVKLKLGPGGMTALVGRNGCGKTTLIKLIQGLYKPTDGRVLLDGADIAQFTRSEIAAWIGYAPQECVLFTGTIRDNIAISKPGAPDEEVIESSTKAGVHQFIIDLPDGYATQIGESGHLLSGGQRQRIAIARALL